jgi:hypothetical protein
MAEKTTAKFRVIGPNTINGNTECWAFPDLELATQFAEHLCKSTGEIVEVAQLVGHWKQQEVPVEFIPVIKEK